MNESADDKGSPVFCVPVIKNAREAEKILSEAMNMTGFYPDGPLDPGMSENFLKAQEHFRNVLNYIRKIPS